MSPTERTEAFLAARGVRAPEVRARLHDLFHGADGSIRAAGERWYEEAHDLAVALAEESDHTLAQAAAVIAALSPQMPWDRNVTSARALLLAHQSDPNLPDEQAFAATKTLHATALQALAALRADDPASALTGPKRRAFYANIVDPRGDRVTVDGHMVNAMVGLRGAVGRAGKLLERGRYEWFASIVAEIAREHGLAPAQYQAVVWLAHGGGDGINGN